MHAGQVSQRVGVGGGAKGERWGAAVLWHVIESIILIWKLSVV